ncbi:IclR family transcriptional regulator [Cytobacillus sp. Hz8]|uniref:IclR family transcriptional regulator n=1 Tax=Cytobacillus sp. Hz8 TaxID=3347168 RepID=UPI0035D59BB4
MPIIQSVQRALQILDLFDEQTTELQIKEISERMGLHKSTLHSLLKTLQEERYIDQNPENGKYKLGMKLVERGNLVTSTIDIRKSSKKYLQDLSEKTGQTVHLGILDGKEGVYIDKVEGALALIRYSRIGKRIPLHSTAVGKVLLAFRAPEEIDRLLDNYKFTQHTSNTITDEKELLDELEKIRLQGFAVDDEENEQGVRCIAVPILNYEHRVIAAISMSTLIARVNIRELDQYIALLKQAGKELSEQLGNKN